ncbi:MAG: dihydroxyacetone kinase subunit DhaK, partial [Ruminiclostridium sp.]
NIFASPDPMTIFEVIKAADCGKGVLLVYGNYAGDCLNFDMAVEMADADGIKTKTIRVWDDVASAPIERIEDRRGVAGDIFVMKIAGAATAMGLSLEDAFRVTEKARDLIRSIGVAVSPGSIPGEDKPQFTLADDEIEFGMGVHGEPGVKRTKMMKADELTETMMDSLLNDISLKTNDEVCVLINGLGSTTLMELFIINRKVTEILSKKGINIYDIDINSFCTTQEMGGASITIMLIDEELKKYYDYPVFTPFYAKQGKTSGG